MPTKTVLYTDLEKFDNNGLRMLRSDEYSQMSGRAGRRGLDKFGSVIILPTFSLPFENDMKKMMIGKSPLLSSKFKLSYQFVLKTLYSGTFNVDDFLSKTLIMNENDKKVISMYIEKDNVEKELNKIIIDEKEMGDLKNYDKIVKRLGDTFFTLKKRIKKNWRKIKK